MLRPTKRNGNTLKHSGLGRTASAKLNAKQIQNELKPIHLSSAAEQAVDIKTLKKPLPRPQPKEQQQVFQHDSPVQDRISITLGRFAKDPQNKVLSCLYGLAAQKSKSRPIDLNNYDYYSPSPIIKKALIDTDNTDVMISLERTIKHPMSLQPKGEKPQPPKLDNFISSLDDGNSVIKVYMKNNYEELPQVDRIDDITVPNQTKVSQLAEGRLRAMFNKKNRSVVKEEPTPTKSPQQPPKASAHQSNRQVAADQNNSTSMVEEIVVEEEYLQDSFEKESQIKESIIKQSIMKESNIKQSIIRESIDNRSGVRQSIHESIPKQSRVSSMSAIKEQISKSRHSIAESIHEVTERPKKKQQDEQPIDESIEEVYDEDFEAASGSASAVKPYVTPAKQQQSDPSEESMSKSFRKKKSVHTPHIGSIKLAEEINHRQSQKQFEDFLKNKEAGFVKHGLQKQFGHMKDIVAEQQQLEKVKKEVNEMMNRTKTVQEKWKKDEHLERERYSKDRVNNLYYRFQSELTRLVNDQDLNFKIQKLTSFLPAQGPSQQGQGQDGLTNIILSRILDAITNLRETTLDYKNLRDMQQEYEKKMQSLLQNQERLMRFEMEKRLDQRDEQIRKLIEGLTTTRNAGSTGRDRIMDVLKKNRKSNNDARGPRPTTEEDIAEYSARFDQLSGTKKDLPSFSQSLEKDQSSISEAVSWDSSIDLWQNLSESDKARLYAKQAGQVTDLLTKMMLQEIKDEALKRSLDVSFEFPEVEPMKNSLTSEHLPPLSQKHHDDVDEFKPAFDRSSLIDELSDSGDSQTEYVKPSYPEPKQPPPKAAPTHSPPEGVEEEPKKTLEKDPKTVEKAKKVTSKYQKKLKSKKDQTVRKLLKLLKTKAPIAQTLFGFTILEQKEVEKEELSLLRAYEQIILNEMVAFYNSHRLPQQQLEQEMRKRYDRIVTVAADSLVNGVSLVVPMDAEDPKESRLPLRDRLYKLESKPLLLQQSLSESLVQFDNQRRQKQVRSSIEQQIIAELILDAARDLKKRR